MSKREDGTMIPGKNFKFPRQVRGLLGSISDKSARDTFRQNMIQAQLYSEIRPEKESKKK